jgi:hypothetical protein
MQDMTLAVWAATHQTYAVLLAIAGHLRPVGDDAQSMSDRDRGAVSLEQVLWFVAAGLSVAVVSTLLWNRITAEAGNNSNVTRPVAPTP